MSKRSRPSNPSAPSKTPARVPQAPAAPPGRVLAPEPVTGAATTAPAEPAAQGFDQPVDPSTVSVPFSAHDQGELLALVHLPKRREGPVVMRVVIPVPHWAELAPGELPEIHASGWVAEPRIIARRGDGSPELLLVRAWVDRPDLPVGSIIPVEIRRGIGHPAPKRSTALVAAMAAEDPAVSLPGFELVDARGRRHAIAPEAWRPTEVGLTGQLDGLTLAAGGEAVARATIVGAAPGEKSPLVARVWLEYSADNEYALELVVANAAQGLAPEADCYDLPFQLAAISVRQGWLAMPASYRAGMDVASDADGRDWIDLVARAPADRPHVFLAQQARLLRFVLVPLAHAHSRPTRAFESFGFAVAGPWSWGAVPADGPQRGRLHRWTSAFDYWGLASGDRAAVTVVEKEAAAHDLVLRRGQWANPETGSAFTSTLVDQLGLAHPDGTQEEGQPGGWRVRPCGTYVLDQALLQRRWTELETMVDRHRAFLLHEADVTPIAPSAWAAANSADGEQRVPFDYRLHGEMTVPWLRRKYGVDDAGQETAGVITTESSSIELGASVRTSPEFLPLARFRRIDDQHYERIAEPAATLAQLTGSPGALFVVEVLGVNALTAFTSFEHEAESWSPGQTMRVLVVQAKTSPGRGHDVAGRGLYWAMLALCSLHRHAPQALRHEIDATFELFVGFMEDVEMPNGLHQSYGRGTRHYDDAVRNGAPAGFRYAQTFEEALGALALIAVSNAADDRPVGRLRASRARARAERIAEALLLGEVQRSGGVAWFVGVADVDTGVPLERLRADATSTHVEADHVHHLAWSGAACSASNGPMMPAPRNRYLARLLELGSGGPNYAGFIHNLQAREREWGQGRTTYASHAVGELQRLLAEGGAG